VAQIEPDLLADIIDAAAELNPGDGMSPKVLRALAQHLGARNVRRSAETGAGGSTVLFSHLSARHTAFAIEGNNRIITRLKASLLLRQENTEFVEGPTQRTLPRQTFDRALQAVLIDGPHAFPFPQLEYCYFYPNIAGDGLLILDDIHIRTIHELYRFLCAEDMFELVQVVERTAFFRRTTAPVFDPFGDGWWLQGHNRKRLLRYIWREALARSLPQPIRAFLRESRAAFQTSFSPRLRYLVRIDTPEQNGMVDQTALVRGQAELPTGACLCLFARRADSTGWWPQSEPFALSGNEWQQTCRFGEAADEGYVFNIAAVATDERGQQRVRRWFAESSRSGYLSPMYLPAALPGSGIAIVRVVRARPDRK
jgi:hypothetical protein